MTNDLVTKCLDRRSRSARGDASLLRLRIPFVILISTFVNLPSRGILAQESFDKPGLVFDVAWPTERIELADGRVLRGLIEEESGGHLTIFEVRRRPGRTPSLVRHFLARADVAKLDRLPDEDRAKLTRRLDAVRNRAAIETGRMRDVDLESVDRDGAPFSSYAGPLFRLEAALAPWEVRTIVVRLEQVFHGFEQVLGRSDTAPREQNREIAFLVFGDHRHYAAFLRREGLAIRNPAFFDPARMRVVVSSDLSRLHQTHDAIQKGHASRKNELFPHDRSRLAEALTKLDAELQEGGLTEGERKDIVLLTVRRWRAEQEAFDERVRAANRRNADEVFRERRSLQHRLFHEAFHAYAEQNLFPSEEAKMPRWLAEGLAQIFESALFEADDLLRIDAPDPERLARLQNDLASAAPLPLADVLVADQASFLVPHDDSGRTSERHYLYAWGLAYFLAFEHEGFTPGRLSEYVAASDASPTAAFERLVNMPLPAFETEWRETMGAISPSE